MFTEHYFFDLPSISTVVLSKTGGAELVLLSSFDCYQLGDLIRRVGGARRNPCVLLTENNLIHQLAGQQYQLTTDLDMVKMQLAELVEHLKRVGDAKKGKVGRVDWWTDPVDKEGKYRVVDRVVHEVEDQALEAIKGVKIAKDLSTMNGSEARGGLVFFFDV
ncbi:NAC domain-containing protein 16-like [Dorcoceras hygrometricum]|uniref:NAC domain-containing protein 16-like n=1 Tax=Dorcoceras hygrometricum TaxID=472368 RepID=A0A2Z7CZ78_9LAMI|nr:NAC domain-containing protein 16-like [Dorcoceras hygrometricum]